MCVDGERLLGEAKPVLVQTKTKVFNRTTSPTTRVMIRTRADFIIDAFYNYKLTDFHKKIDGLGIAFIFA